MFCFDTDIVAAALLREPPLPLVRRLARTPPDQQCTTAVTVAEITYAAARNGDADTISRLRDVLAAASTVLPFDADAAEVYGPLRTHLEGIGVRLDEPSLRIASIVLAHDLTLVSTSARLYDRVPGLRIENWLEPDDAELIDALEEPGAIELVETMPVGNGEVRHPGLVPSLEARARAAADAETEAPTATQ